MVCLPEQPGNILQEAKYEPSGSNRVRGRWFGPAAAGDTTGIVGTQQNEEFPLGEKTCKLVLQILCVVHVSFASANISQPPVLCEVIAPNTCSKPYSPALSSHNTRRACSLCTCFLRRRANGSSRWRPNPWNNCRFLSFSLRPLAVGAFMLAQPVSALRPTCWIE